MENKLKKQLSVLFDNFCNALKRFNLIIKINKMEFNISHNLTYKVDIQEKNILISYKKILSKDDIDMIISNITKKYKLSYFDIIDFNFELLKM